MTIAKALNPENLKPNIIMEVMDSFRQKFASGGRTLDQKILDLEEFLNSVRGLSPMDPQTGYYIEQMEDELRELKGMRAKD